MTGSDGQYDNENVAAHASSLHQKNLIYRISTQPNPTHKKLLFPDPTQLMDGTNASQTPYLSFYWRLKPVQLASEGACNVCRTSPRPAE